MTQNCSKNNLKTVKYTHPSYWVLNERLLQHNTVYLTFHSGKHAEVYLVE